MQPENPKRRYNLFSKQLGSCVEPMLRPVFKAQGAAASKLMSEWPMIVGADMAAYSAPTKLSFAKQKNNEGTLTVACEGAHALTLQHMVPLILERITNYFGYQAVARISIEQRLISPPRPAAKKRTISSKKIDSSCLENVEDSELREALRDFAKELANPSS